MRARSYTQAAAILAGGRATRFGGRDKSALVVAGRTIRDRLMKELASVVGLCEILWVGVGTPTAPAGARLVADIVPGSGPLGGIHAALIHGQADATFIAACDMPFVTAALVARLFDEFDAADAPGIVVPQTDRGYHPLCAVYGRACLEPIARRLADRQLKVLDLFADVRTRVVTLVNDEVRLLANVNTPDEFTALHGHNKL